MNKETILHICDVMLVHAKITANIRYEKVLNRVYFSVNDNLTVVAGRAYVQGSRYGRVEISLPIFMRTPCMAELVETILHEMAHIMEPDDNHGMKWMLATRSIGGTGARCHSMIKGYTKKEKEKIAARSILQSL